MTTLLIIIPDAIRDSVRTVAEAAFGAQVQAEFISGLSPTGGLPATYWWLAGQFAAEDLAKVEVLRAHFPAALVESYDFMADPGRPMVVLGELGLKPLAAEVPA